MADKGPDRESDELEPRHPLGDRGIPGIAIGSSRATAYLFRPPMVFNAGELEPDMRSEKPETESQSHRGYWKDLMNLHLGIDIGAQGAIAILDKSGALLAIHDRVGCWGMII